MKKLLKISSLLLLSAMMIGCASKPAGGETYPAATFTKDYDVSWFRTISKEDYEAGKYRSNFKKLEPKNVLIATTGSSFSFTNVYDFSGSFINLGLSDSEKLEIVLTDGKDKVFFNSATWANEMAGLKIGNNDGICYVTEVPVNGVNYVLAIAYAPGCKSGDNKFTLWVEDTIPTDKAEKANGSDGSVNYDWVDIKEGVYLPGYKHVWGTAADDYADCFNMKNFAVRKYSYNGYDFVIGGSNVITNMIIDTDKNPIDFNITKVSRVMTGNKGKRSMGLGMGLEGKIKLGDKNVDITVFMFDGAPIVFIKE